MSQTTEVNNPTNKKKTGGGGKNTEKKKKKDDGKAGKKKKAQLRYKNPSNMCWDLFPMFPYDVRDVNKPNKYILLAITSILWCFSVVTVCIGAYLIVQRKSRDEVISASSVSGFWLNFSLVLLCNGLVFSIINFCGLVGVQRENVPLIRVFYISLIVELVLKLGVAVFVFVFADYSRPLLESMLAEQAVVDYRASSDVETLMDYLQTAFRCCGLRDDGFQDWSRNIYFNCSAGNPSPERCGVPWSCCRNHTGISNALCGLDVQKLDRNIASRTIHTMGCLHAIQLWVSSHAVTAGLVGLLEVIGIVTVTFQCTRLVNELQMIRGVYRGPWWDRIGASRKARPQKDRKTLPPGAASGPSRSPRPSPGPSAQPQPTELASEDSQQRAKLHSVVQIGHGPAVRRTKPASPARKERGSPGQPPGETSDQPPASNQSNQPPGEDSIQPLGEESNQPLGEESNQPSGELAGQQPGVISNQATGELSSQPVRESPTGSDGQVTSERAVFSTTFCGVTGASPDQTQLVGVGELLESAAEKSYFCHTESQGVSVAPIGNAIREGAGGTDTVDSVVVEIANT